MVSNLPFCFKIWNRLEECLELLCKSNRLPEAAFLARTYLPSQVPRIVKLWKEDLAKTNKKAADSLADPTQYSNLFPDIQEAIRAETVVVLFFSFVIEKISTVYFFVTPNLCFFSQKKYNFFQRTLCWLSYFSFFLGRLFKAVSTKN